jgi:antitoxin CptB
VTELTRVIWACRRGMLELDLLLMPFAQAEFQQLPAQQQMDFIELLSFPDPTLLNWLMGYEDPDESRLNTLVRQIRDFSIDRIHAEVL